MTGYLPPPEPTYGPLPPDVGALVRPHAQLLVSGSDQLYLESQVHSVHAALDKKNVQVTHFILHKFLENEIILFT